MALGDLRYKGIIFGCDNFATVVDETIPYKDEKSGIEMKKYLIIPSIDLFDAYPHILKKPGILNAPTPIGRGMWVEYPTMWISDENNSRKNAIARVDCSFDGRETAQTRRYAKLTRRIRELEMENELLTIGSIVDRQEKGELIGDAKVLAKKLTELNEIFKGERHEDYSDDAVPQQQ